MKLLVVGAGYVGLVSATCFAEFGFDVICVDQDAEKIKRLKNLEIPIYEPGLENLVRKGVEEGRLSFSDSLSKTVNQNPDVQVIFLAVGTPTRRGSDEADLKYIEAVIDELALLLNQESQNQSDKTIVIKSTVPVGTTRAMAARFRALNPGYRSHSNQLPAKIAFASNPEFLREGAALHDFMKPDRVIVGLENPELESAHFSYRHLETVYRPLYLFQTPSLFVDLESAELIKYASNAFLATKIAFINEMADLAEACGADVQKVAQGMGLDGRIGAKFLHPGPGFGGSCFPKDTRALMSLARRQDAPSLLVEAVVASNTKRQTRMLDKITKAAQGQLADCKIAILGVAFKPQTDDIRESPALGIISELLRQGAFVQAHDPIAMPQAKAYFKSQAGLSWHENAYEAIKGTSIVVLITEWNTFRSLNLPKVAELMEVDPGLGQTKTFIDLRNVYDLKDWKNLNVNYISIGRKGIKAINA
ncbi:MAG: UDP-glucose dehydrogenase family protein [Gammaproteobacteria bacterium]